MARPPERGEVLVHLLPGTTLMARWLRADGSIEYERNYERPSTDHHEINIKRLDAHGVSELHMTWKEFVAKVEKQMQENGVSQETRLLWVSWDETAFGGPVPDVYVNVLTKDDGEYELKDGEAGLGIGED